MQESRTKKTLLNARVNLIFYFLTLVLSFFSRKIFLDSLGTEFIGFTGTLQNLLGFLNLAELGIGSAIGYVLYKPLYEHDQQKINEIISVMGYLYRWIGFIILGAGLILACFLPLIFPNTQFDLGLIFFAYFSFLASSLIGYFVNYRQNLLGADQRNYIVTGYFQSMTIIKTLVQMVLAYYTGSYYLWLAIELIFGIVYSFVLNHKINAAYPWLRADVKQGKQLFKKYPEVMIKTKQLFVHQINGFIQFQMTPFLTYAFVSLKVVAYYGNYTLIVDKLAILMNTFLGSIGASVGNLIAEGNEKRIYDVFYEHATVRFYCASAISFILYSLLEPFIALWIGEVYLLERTVLILVVLKIYIQISAGSVPPFLFGYGLFSDVWSSIIQSIIFLLSAVVGGFLYGLNGIITASIVSIFIIQGIWKPFYLFRKGFKKSVLLYWLYWFGMNGINILSIICSLYLIDKLGKENLNSVVELFLHSMKAIAVYVTISMAFYLTLTKSSKRLLNRFLKI